MQLHHPPPSSLFSHLHPRNPSPSLHRLLRIQSPATHKPPILITTTTTPLTLPSPDFPICRAHHGEPITPQTGAFQSMDTKFKKPKNQTKSFWAAISLIIGTAVGPGMLGLPSLTIRSGPIPSTIAIILSWAYVVSSIILVAELSFAAMEDDGVEEVSFTALATKALGPKFGSFVAVVYASLSFALLIACVSGIGSLAVRRFPTVNPVVAHATFPCFVGIVIGFFPFKAIDFTNRLFCSLMLLSIAALVGVGVSVGRSNLLGSLVCANWSPEAMLPAIPVTVLTLGFHVITPFVCKLVGDSIYDARKAILFGGAVPLAMVLSWNAVVLGLAATGSAACEDPIKLLLSVNPSALPAVQGFAFAALATSLIGYAVSFPKQLVDTKQLIAQLFDRKGSQKSVNSREAGQTSGGAVGALNEVSSEDSTKESTNEVFPSVASSSNALVMWVVLAVPVLIASFFCEAFSKALNFAGVYANCFLFGILPPVMAWIHRSRKRERSSNYKEDLLPGGGIVLAVLFCIAVILGCWH